MPREIITFQLGSHANHTGTHWWNIQEAAFIYDPTLAHTKEIDNDILYRVGQNAYNKMETYTPRLLLYDVSSSTPLSNLLQNNAILSNSCCSDLSRTIPTSRLWSEKIETIDLRNINNELFYNGATNQQDDAMQCEDANRMDIPEVGPASVSEDTESIKKKPIHQEDIGNPNWKWTDYIISQLHPHTISWLPKCITKNFPDVNMYGLRNQCLEDKNFSDTFDENLHFFVEDCDNLQGFQFLVDMHDGFGNLCSHFTSIIADDYSKSSLVHYANLYPQMPPQFDFSTYKTHLTTALNLAEHLDYTNLIVPISLLHHSSSFTSQSQCNPSHPNSYYPLINSQLTTQYHSSAVTAAAIDSTSLVYRILDSGMDIQDFSSLLSPLSRKISILKMSLPLPLVKNSSLLDSLIKSPLATSSVNLTPYVDDLVTADLTFNTVRGIPLNYPTFNPNSPNFSPHYSSFPTAGDFISDIYSKLYAGCTSMSLLVNTPLKLRQPFPSFFSPTLSDDGLVSNSDYNNSDLASEPKLVNQTPVATSIENNIGITKLLTDHAFLFDIKSYRRLFTVACEAENDHFDECKEKLLTMRDNYKSNLGKNKYTDDSASDSDCD